MELEKIGNDIRNMYNDIRNMQNDIDSDEFDEEYLRNRDYEKCSHGQQW